MMHGAYNTNSVSVFDLNLSKASIHELILTDNNRMQAPKFLSYAYIPYLSFTSFFLVFIIFLLLILCYCSSLFHFLEIFLSSYTNSCHSPNCNAICEIRGYTGHTDVPKLQIRHIKILHITLYFFNTDSNILLHTDLYKLQNKP